MNLRSTIAASLLACAAALVPPHAATAQYWSLGVSMGGGTNIAVHGGMHLGNTDDRRESGLTGGRTEIELVVGMPRHARSDGSRRNGWSLGMNVRQTARNSGISIGAGFRFAPLAADGTTDWQTVFHIPVVGWEPYPLPARLFVFHGLGRRLVPTEGGGLANRWDTFLARPQLQVYLKHTGGFHFT